MYSWYCTLLRQYFVSVAVLCHVYITMDSYLSMRAHVGVMAQELLQAVAERMDVPQGELVLVAVTYPGGIYCSSHKATYKCTVHTTIP